MIIMYLSNIDWRAFCDEFPQVVAESTLEFALAPVDARLDGGLDDLFGQFVQNGRQHHAAAVDYRQIVQAEPARKPGRHQTPYGCSQNTAGCYQCEKAFGLLGREQSGLDIPVKQGQKGDGPAFENIQHRIHADDPCGRVLAGSARLPTPTTPSHIRDPVKTQPHL